MYLGEEVAHCCDVGCLQVVASNLISVDKGVEGVDLCVVCDDGVTLWGGQGGRCGDVVVVSPGGEVVFLLEAFGIVVGWGAQGVSALVCCDELDAVYGAADVGCIHGLDGASVVGVEDGLVGGGCLGHGWVLAWG